MKKIVDWIKKLLGMSSDNSSSGFTLIELLVVIGILGILAAVLIVLIDPVDKINAANDTGVISTAIQAGRANDSYAATHSNSYVGGNCTTASATCLNSMLTDLKTNGESKFSSYTAPTGYTLTYLTNPAACTTVSGLCTGYAIIITALKSKKYTATPVYQYVNGNGCFVATAITQAQLNTGSGAGFCP